MASFNVRFKNAQLYLAFLVAKKTLNKDEWAMILLFLGLYFNVRVNTVCFSSRAHLCRLLWIPDE